jgi:hypothetical protein
MAVVARDGIEPPPLQQFLFSEKNTRYAGRTSAARLSVPLESVQKVGICGDFGRFLICRCGEDGPEDEMAVEAVPSEPLSRLDSLLSGINTGKFRTVVRLTDWDYSSTLLNPSDFF